MLVIILLVLSTTTTAFAQKEIKRKYPDAQCRITWEIPMTCAATRDNIRNQMIAWRENEHRAKACPGRSPSCPKLPCGQRCRYVFERIDKDGKIFGYHLTPKYAYRDNINFAFKDVAPNKCVAVGFSKSTISYAYFDFGTNYCNLRNLMDGARLSTLDGFTETTSTSICTQYDQINCDRF